MIRKIGRQ